MDTTPARTPDSEKITSNLGFVDPGLPVPAIVFRGLADATVHPGIGEAIIAQALHARPGLDRVHLSGVSAGERGLRQTRYDHADGRSTVEDPEVDRASHA